MIVLNNNSPINLADLTNKLPLLGINNLTIISINLSDDIESEVFEICRENTLIVFREMGVKYFVEFISTNSRRFSEFNPNALYVLRDGSYTDIKYIISQIKVGSGVDVNLGRGGSQKSHLMSPLELRLYTYIMAMFDFNYKVVKNSNTFNSLHKSRYLPFIQNQGNKLGENKNYFRKYKV